MFALGLLVCVGLRVFSAQAKVVTSFQECREFFYNGVEPAGMDQNAKKICQMLTESSGSYYATLYSVPHRIPLYSSAGDWRGPWSIEPQISQPRSTTVHMVREMESNLDIVKKSQAISTDYAETGYDRGHLNPNSFQCGEGRTATFTLTNAVPMDACFNRIQWKNWELTLRSFLTNKLSGDGNSANIYIVTGTVPGVVRIPQREVSGDPERVTVPSHIWTAVCYKHNTDDEKSLSFGYLGTNRPEGGISLMSVSDLNYRLRQQTGAQIQIFTDNCFGDNNKLSRVQDAFKNLIRRQLRQVKMSERIGNTYNAMKTAVNGDGVASQSVRVSEMTVKLAFDSLRFYSTGTESLKTFDESACLITRVEPLLRAGQVELKKRDVSEASGEVEKQKTAADGSPCSSVSDSKDRCVCGSGGKPCCSAPCLYNDRLQGYRCYSGQQLIECSPRYSLITAKGERCKDDHPCATYGKDYYWCNRASGGWDYCSPPLWSSKAENGQDCRSDRACGKYGTKHPWCYTDNKGKKYKCCTSDDCYSAVNG